MRRSGAARRLRRATLEARRAGGGSVGLVDVTMMRRALRLARRAAELGEVPVGAVVYRGRTVLGEAHNLREASHDPAGHAEMLALRQAAAGLGRWRLTGCSIAVTLEPCPMCAGALVNARLDRLVYGAVDPKAGACISLYAIPTDPRLNHRLETVGGVLARECGAILSGFFRSRRRQAALTRGVRRRGGGQDPSAPSPAGERP